MSSFKKTLLATAVAMAAVSMCAHTEEPKSMFKDAPSVSSQTSTSISEHKGGSIKHDITGSISDNPGYRVQKLPDGRVSIKGKIHGGRGLDMEVITPVITPVVTLTGPGGVDENGNPMTVQQKREREIAHRFVFEALKSQGYEFEKHRKSREGVKTQLDEWNEKTEATRKYIAEHGPITTKDFILPGSTPELSAKLSDPDVGVRKENGKFVYYLNGEKLNVYPDKKKIERKPENHAATITKTSVSKSTRKLTKEEKARAEALAKANPKDPFAAMEKPLIDGMPKEPPKRAFEPEPEEDLRRRPTDINLSPEEMPSTDEVVDSIEEMFPDMGKLNSTSENSKLPRGIEGVTPDNALYELHRLSDRASGELIAHVSPSVTGKTLDVARAGERLLSFALGISDVYASESEEKPKVAPESEGVVSGTLKAMKNVDKFQALIDEIHVKTNDSLADDNYHDILKGIRDRHEKIVKSVTKPDDKKDAEADEANTNAETEGVAYVDRVKIDGQEYDPAEFAADVVNRISKSLTPDQFQEDVQAIVESLSEKKVNGGVDVLATLGEILDANPEIFEAIPDADKRLQRLRGDVYDIMPPNPNGEQTLIFVSYSLSDEVIKDILERNANRSDVMLVMRGVPEGMRIDNGLLKMQELVNSVSPPVPLILDPPLFDVYGITKVPSVVRAGRTPPKTLMNPNDPKGRRYAEMIAKVEGLHNDRWLIEQIEAGERGDLGQQGNVKEISEPNLIDEMKRRVALIDWDKKKKEAAARFWKKQTFKVFPTASEDRVREIDPSILVERDLKDLAGNPIRRAGDIVNPLQIRPFTQTVLIFNPLSKDEMDRVEAYREAFKKAGKFNLVLIATQMDKDKSWEGYKALTDRLDQHVFMMTPEVEYQWRIEKTPAVVTADNKRHIFLVEELGPLESEKEAE